MGEIWLPEGLHVTGVVRPGVQAVRPGPGFVNRVGVVF
jgi:hypothetical protein